MPTIDEQACAHALRARAHAMPPEGLPAGVVLDSWVRCMHAGLDVAAPLQVPVVDGADLARRRERAAVVRRLAQAELETLSRQIAGSNYLLAFADQEGVILDLYADNRFTMSGPGADIVAGSRWAETLCGTNGLGTALATGQPVAVTGLEHYFLQLGDVSCTAAPVRDARGDIVGVLDASSHYDSRQRHTQALVQMGATHIENGLFVHQMRGETVLAIHPRAEFLRTLSAGLLAFAGDGRLRAANLRATQLLAGLTATPGTPFEDLFGEPFERVLAQLHVGHEVQLRDVLGSALVATAVARPPVQPIHLGAAPRAALAAPADARAPLPAKSTARGGPRPDAPVPAPVPAPASVPVGFVADDPAVAAACRTVQAAVGMQVPILIQGGTGSGKELLARLAHDSSGRRGEFVAVNCAALPDALFEAELFGYVGGAFTGARREGSIGLIASADGGTLLLDEVRELPLPLQAALLRFLDDRLVRPVGGTAARRVDVQLLAATNLPLEDEVAARRFRDDLMYRLNTVKVVLPPLRRRNDFAAAVHSLLHTLDRQARIRPDALQRLARHGWPGNFRELRAVLTQALLARRSQGRDHQIGLEDVDPLLPAAAGAAGLPAPAASALRTGATDLVLREFERCGRSVSRTSRSLGISRTTVYRHLREAGADSAAPRGR